MRAALRWILALSLAVWAAPVLAQNAGGAGSSFGLSTGVETPAQSSILVIDSDRLFSGSQFGRTVATEIEAASRDLQQENRRIEAELFEEERELTEQRTLLPADEFRTLADAFDEKVQRIRREREAALRGLQQRLEDEERAFLMAAGPVLEEIMREAGAAVILEQRSVFVNVRSIDITDIAIARIDRALEAAAPGTTDDASEGVDN